MNSVRAADSGLTVSGSPLVTSHVPLSPPTCSAAMTVPSADWITPMIVSSAPKRPMESLAQSGCVSSDDESSVSKKQKVSPPSSDDESCSSKETNRKGNSQLQKKYDPENVQAMSKVELSLWRRQQRKQRNRISAAVSRQKQKSRIVELEQELNEWKEKVQAIQQQLQVHQENMPSSIPSVQQQESLLPDPEVLQEVVTSEVDPQAPVLVGSSSSVLPSSLVSLQNQKPFKMISRQAVKIANMGSSDFIYDTNDDVMTAADITISIPPEASVSPDVTTSEPITLLHEDDDILLSNLVLDTLEKHEPQSLWIDDASDDSSLFAGLEDTSSVTSMDALLFDKFLLDDDDNDEWL